MTTPELNMFSHPAIYLLCDDESIHGSRAGSVNYACHIDLPPV